MTAKQVMTELAAKGSESTKRIFLRHGAREPFFGVKIGDLKPIAKKIRGRQDLALELYATGNGDAQYLAGMVADGKLMSRNELQSWAASASWGMISGTTVPWVASEHADGFALARAWTAAREERLAVAGWATLGAIVTVRPDAELPAAEIKALLDHVARAITTAPDRVRYQMNYFVIACGTYCGPVAEHALAVARKVGRVEVDMGDTGCQVPEAESYIRKSRRGAPLAAKRKTVRC